MHNTYFTSSQSVKVFSVCILQQILIVNWLQKLHWLPVCDIPDGWSLFTPSRMGCAESHSSMPCLMDWKQGAGGPTEKRITCFRFVQESEEARDGVQAVQDPGG